MAKRDERIKGFIYALAAILVLGCPPFQGIDTRFQYRNRVRWAGAWDNPNTFGLLAGVGIVLFYGLIIDNVRLGVRYKDRWQICIRMFCMTILGMGLFNSLSRGAWIATFSAIFYLSWPECLSHVRIRYLLCRGGWTIVGSTLVAAIVLCSCFVHRVSWTVMHRGLSVANQNDFSWRNRIGAWEGLLQITAESPWLGKGWIVPESLYCNYYLSPRINDGAAVQMNDYLLLAAAFGVPGFFCFAAYFWSSFRIVSQKKSDRCGPSNFLRRICHAASVVLLIGFWFDGGLLVLETSAVFWVLFELGNTFYTKQASISTTTDGNCT